MLFCLTGGMNLAQETEVFLQAHVKFTFKSILFEMKWCKMRVEEFKKSQNPRKKRNKRKQGNLWKRKKHVEESKNSQNPRKNE